MISLPELASKRGWRCEVCGRATVYLERHHCLHHRMKGKPELDDERNLQLTCKTCHRDSANSYENRESFWRVQLTRYPDMREWYNKLPLKVKENFG